MVYVYVWVKISTCLKLCCTKVSVHFHCYFREFWNGIFSLSGSSSSSSCPLPFLVATKMCSHLWASWIALGAASIRSALILCFFRQYGQSFERAETLRKACLQQSHRRGGAAVHCRTGGIPHWHECNRTDPQ